MSRENEATIHRLLEAFNYTDERSIAALDECDPEIAIRDYPGFPDAQWHHGHLGVETWAAKIWMTGSVQFEPVEFFHVSEDRFVVHVSVQAVRAKRSEAPLPDFDAFGDFTVRNGKILRVEVFENLQEALEAVAAGGRFLSAE
jgi:ketosteroid isomerase-like protein